MPSPSRPLERFVEGWERVLARVRGGGVNSVSVVGGGAAGVELAFAMDHRFRTEAGDGAPHVRILTDAPAGAARVLRLARARGCFAWRAGATSACTRRAA